MTSKICTGCLRYNSAIQIERKDSWSETFSDCVRIYLARGKGSITEELAFKVVLPDRNCL